MSDGDPDENGVEDPTELMWVGPATAEVVETADFDADDLAAKRVSYRMLVDAGVNAGVAAKIRREHSLSWSFESSDDLDRRSTQIRGLGEDEAAWVAASSGDWANDGDGNATADGQGTGSDDEAVAEDVAGSGGPATAEADGDTLTAEAEGDGDRLAAEADGSGDPLAAEAAWRHRSKPTPVTELDAVATDDAERLADAGITSVRSLATADPEHVADVLELDPDRVDDWNAAANEAADD